HARRVVEDALEQARDAGQALGLDPPPNATAERRPRVAAEVEAVCLVDARGQEVDLDRLEVPSPFRLASITHGAGASYSWSQTRISERSWSTSMGLAM